MALATYDPSAVMIYLAGVAVEDVMDGTFVRIAKDSQVFTSVTSTDGQVYRKRSSSTSYTLSITLSSSSKTNKVLQYFLIADQLTSLGKFPLMIKDGSGSSLFFATTFWIEQQPDMVFSEDVRAMPWTIRCTGSTISFGDNYDPSSLTDDALNVVVGSIPSLAGLL